MASSTPRRASKPLRAAAEREPIAGQQGAILASAKGARWCHLLGALGASGLVLSLVGPLHAAGLGNGAWRGAPGVRSSEAPYGFGARSLFELTLLGSRPGRLSAGDALPLLSRYRAPARSGEPSWRVLWSGRYGFPSWRGSAELVWSAASCDAAANETPELPVSGSSAAESLARWHSGVAGSGSHWLTPAARPWIAELGPEWQPLGTGGVLFEGPVFLPPLPDGPPPRSPAIPARTCPGGEQPRPVSIARSDGEWDRFVLLDCERGISTEALDRLSVLARPSGVPRPLLPLPDEPAGAGDEWVPGVKLLHPRLFWVLQRLADAFPRRVIEIYSGYRREGSPNAHGRGRALDVAVRGVPNEVLFALCRNLDDVGCGYYPNNYFVHFDVREYGSHHPFWIDVSAPGEPSRYVDSVLPEGAAPSSAAVPPRAAQASGG